MKLLKRSAIAALALVGIVAGNATPAAAIVGGQDATQTYPGVTFVSVLRPDGRTAVCGGFLVHPRFVLTAAHCVSDPAAVPVPVPIDAERARLRVGSTDRTTGGETAIGRRVFLYPEWSWNTTPNALVSDFALVELATPLSGPTLRLGGGPVSEGEPLRLVGWGLTAFPPPPGATASIVLQQQDTTRLTPSSCADGFMSAADFCVGGGACFGDSGSPALRRVDATTWAAVGIASRQGGPGCGPAVYTDLTYLPYQLWIALTIVTHRSPPCRCPQAQPGVTPPAAPSVRWL